MKTGIICALKKEEADFIIKEFKLKRLKDEFFEVFGSESLVVLISGIGKVYAGMGTQWLINKYKVKEIINIGLAGGIESGMGVGDVYFGERVIQHDVYLPWDGKRFDYLKGDIVLKDSKKMAKKIKMPTKTILTGDQFVDEDDKIRALKKRGDMVEMEAFSVASVCKKFKVPCIIIKAVSDNGDDEAAKDFLDNIRIAMEEAVKVLVLLF